ncbi:MAG TPA: L-alanine exporter AlaE, partial [Marivita sp.]|nr:L-alanine exporter AlaE [Marivita sp.]
MAMKAFAIDTLTTVVFFTIVAGLTELLIAGMEPHQV